MLAETPIIPEEDKIFKELVFVFKVILYIFVFC